MSPTLYNRSDSLVGYELATEKLRQMIGQYHLRSQEFDFIPALGMFSSNGAATVSSACRATLTS